MTRHFGCFWLLFVCSAVHAAITGPTEVQPGNLAKFESDISGDCLVYPVGMGSAALDSNGKTVYFASPEEGGCTLIFFGIREGTPEICTHLFQVTSGRSDDVTPTPTPQPPVTVDISDAEKTAVKAAMQAVLDGISAGTIRTPQGARYTLKNDLVKRVGTCSASGCSVSAKLDAALKQWESEMDITTLDGIKTGFGKVLEALK